MNRPPASNRPLRLGFWCDFGTTLRPHEGIGVFVYSLMEGFLRIDQPVELVVLVRPGDQHLVQNLLERGAQRIEVIPTKADGPRRPLAALLSAVQRLAGGLLSRMVELRESVRSGSNVVRSMMKDIAVDIARRAY